MFKKMSILLVLLFASPAFADKFVLSSPDIGANGFKSEQVFSSFGCTGANLSPALEWKNAPTATKSFGLTMYDPDAPTGSGWWHWLIINIPKDATSLKKGSGDSSGKNLVQGVVQTRTDFGSYGYGGPCPPAGSAPHHYKIKLFALDVDKLPLGKDSSGALVGYNLNAHAIATAELNVNYGR